MEHCTDVRAYPSNGVLTLPEPSRVFDDGNHFFRVYGEGPPVMLIHGNQGSGYSFASMVPAMDGFGLILPDLPGHGYGPPMPKDFENLPDMAVDYCFQVADIAGVEQFAIIGHSLGGMIGLLMCLQNRQRIRGLVLLDSFVAMDERPPELLRVAPYHTASEDARLRIKNCYDDGHGVKWHETFDVSSKIRRIECPVLELQGEATPDTDALYTQWLGAKRSRMHQRWKTARIPDCAHFLQFEQIDAVMAEIMPWLHSIEQI
ncbi:MAG: alpha/beta hydrolase [Eubacteriales bacterium]|nr:alpha/beta hydrolase [Eubacteriales bacterium]